MKIGIAIIHYGSTEITEATYKTVLHSIKNVEDKEIIFHDFIFDNQGNWVPDTGQEPFQNIGYGAGCNYAAHFLKNSDYLIFMNNDCHFFKTTMPQIVEHIKNGDMGDFNSPVVIDSKNQIQYDGGRITFSGAQHYTKGYFRVFKTDFLYGCCMIVKTESFFKIGKFREEYFMYWEDVDFSYRAKKQGYSMKCLGDVFVQHDNKPQFGITRYYHTRNALLFATLNYSTGRYIAFLFYFFLYFVPVRVIYFTFKKKFGAIKYMLEGIKDYFLGRTGKYGENQ